MATGPSGDAQGSSGQLTREPGPPGSMRLGPPGAGGQARTGHTSHKLHAALLLVVWPIARRRLPAKGRENVPSLRLRAEGRTTAQGRNWELESKGRGRGRSSRRNSGGSPPPLHLGVEEGRAPSPGEAGAWHSSKNTGLRNVGGLPAVLGIPGGAAAGRRGREGASDPSPKPSHSTCSFNKSPRGPVCLIHEGPSSRRPGQPDCKGPETRTRNSGSRGPRLWRLEQ